MAAGSELLARDGRQAKHRGTAAGTAILAALLLALAAGPGLVGRGGSSPGATIVVTRADSPLPVVQTLTVTGKVTRTLVRDLEGLQPGRIGCGPPGPADVVIRFPQGSYDVNGECARVVRLPERPGETVWLESAALHDHLAALIGP
jgi:hypothetical protein